MEVPVATLRILSANVTTAEEVQESDFQAATTVAQIFSGIVFAGLGVWMLISNGTKFSYIQRASLEKRLGTCCAIDTYVALFSAFFNFFQLTEVDDLFLPRPGGFTLDFSRPIEWIVTCPMMQVVLVLMGGTRIPEYRRILMPGLSLAVLACGTTSMLTGSPIRFIFYGIGLSIATVMFSLNAKQIMEHSNGEENVWTGDSEFRKASVLLIVTWFPFPMWFFCSPEGVGLIDNILVIQMGWAFLNILSKFTFIFYIQRVKDNYCNRLKVKRELVGSGAGQNESTGMEALAGALGIVSSSNPMAPGSNKSQEKELAAVVIETMNFLGMAQHNDRFLKLLKEAKITSVAMVEALDQEECMKLQLPQDLITALQKRIRVWKLEMTDNAVMELEKGEAHYAANTPTGATDLLPGEVDQQDEMRSQIARALMGRGSKGGDYSADFEQQCAQQFAQVSDVLGMLQQQIEDLNMGQMRRQAELEGSLVFKMEQLMERKQGGESDQSAQMMAQVAERAEAAIDNLGRTMMSKFDSLSASQARAAAENEQQMMQRLSQMVQKANDAASDSLGNAIGAKMDMTQAAQMRQHSELEDSLINRLEGVLSKTAERTESATRNSAMKDGERLDQLFTQQTRKVEHMESSIMQALDALAVQKGVALEQGSEFSKSFTTRMSDLQAAQLRQAEDNLRRKMEECVDAGVGRVEQSVHSMHKMMEHDLNMVARGNDVVAETVRTSSDTQKEGLADLRRVSMMVLEQSSAALDKAQGGIGKMDLLQGSFDTQMGRIYDRLTEMNGGAPSPTMPRASSMSGNPGQWPTQGMPSQSQEGSRRPSNVVSNSRSPSKYGMQVING